MNDLMNDTEQAVDTRTDESLIAAHIAGDAQAFATLVERYQRELYHFLLRFLGDPASADDIFQEAFIQVHRSAAAFEQTRKFRPWLFTIATNKARDLIRSRSRRSAVPLDAMVNTSNESGTTFVDFLQSDAPSPADRVEQAELQSRVQQAVDRLPPNLREVIILAYFQQFPYKQIAEVLDLPLGTVKSRLHSAVEAFANIWKSANPTYS